LNISAELVKALRDKTNCGFMDCKKALQETGGDLEAAVDYLRRKGIAVAAKRAERATSEGAIWAFPRGRGGPPGPALSAPAAVVRAGLSQ